MMRRTALPLTEKLRHMCVLVCRQAIVMHARHATHQHGGLQVTGQRGAAA